MTVNVPFKNRNPYHIIITIFTLCISTLAILFLLIRIFDNPNPLNSFIVTSLFYTTQSNIFVFIVMVLYLLKLSSKKWFHVLALIAIVDILLTGIVFHILLVPYMEAISFMQQLLHTWTPIAYLMFYFIVVHDHLKLSHFWYAIVHPIIFFISVYLWIEPLFGELIEITVLDFEGSRFLYPFLNPANFEIGFIGVFLFSFVIILPLILLLSFGILFIKKRLLNNN
jgi:hypothetical protein